MWPTVLLAVIALTAGLVFYKKWLAPHIFGAIERAHEDAAKLIDIASVLQIDRPLPRLGGWAITPEMALWLLEYIRSQKPNLIVELGSGSSTVIMGRALQRFSPGGRLVSVESDASFADRSRAMVLDWELSNVDVRHAPIIEGWYETSVLGDLRDVDLLLVDGPPGEGGRETRYSAISLFERLTASGIVILDDADRVEESHTVKRWREETNMTTEKLPLPRGVVLLRRLPKGIAE